MSNNQNIRFVIRRNSTGMYLMRDRESFGSDIHEAKPYDTLEEAIETACEQDFVPVDDLSINTVMFTNEVLGSKAVTIDT